jgi:3-hydroxyisobutyrate dehydrogenase-like beta-hydroxyacid dehydrogenase
MHIALIGYGEVGRILAEDLGASRHALVAFDTKLDSSAGAALRAHAQEHQVELAASHSQAVQGAELVICAVTASQTLAAAAACAGELPSGSFFLDFNSASPGTKLAASERITSSGGRYVEGAVMTAVPPYRIKVPLLLGGPHASALEPILHALGFCVSVASERLGVASATKMCRSVMIKGLEALVIESFSAARYHGVETAVIQSLQETFPGIDWEKQASYFFQRVIQHGRRRAEEMQEAALTVRETGLEPCSAEGTVERQASVADLAELGVFGERANAGFARSVDWRTEADRLLQHANRSKEA